ncbi:MAG TPA: CHASE2 domain-containing protein, partial [Thiotrichales bacterium]|nr:CHASE2 domain-containing protein [Thiotrichales bacterium]
MKKGMWRSDWFTGLVITLIFLAFAGSDFIASLERSAYDFGVKSSSRVPSDKIAVIAIDDQSIDNIGRWPWPRDIHAQMHDLLKEGGARAIGQTVFFSEPQLDPGLQFIRELKQAFEESSIAAVPAFVEELGMVIDESRELVKGKRDKNGRAAIQQIADALAASPLHTQVAEELDAYLEYINTAEVVLDTDRTLAESMRAAGNVVLLMPFVPGEAYGQPDGELPEYVQRNQIPADNIFDSPVTNPDGFAPLPVVDAYTPIPLLGEQAEAIGALVALPDVDGAIRTEPLVIDYFGSYYPSMALVLAAESLNLGVEDIRINVGSDVQLGRLKIKTDVNSLMNTFFYSDVDGRPAFTVDSFFDVLQGKIPLDKYKDKIVLIGATALGVGDTFVTPIDPTMAPVLTLAHSVSSILNEDFFI